MNSLRNTLLFTLAAAVLVSCVEHRPIRNGLRNESIYLHKNTIMSTPDGRESNWLFKATVVGASSPNVVGDYAFPGFESELKLVNFRFTEDKLQVLDGRRYQMDALDNPNDDTPTRVERMIMEFNGQHVDIKLRESLNGERTNFLEENTEEPWARRQNFKVDFESSSMDPVAAIVWYYGEWTHECGSPISTRLVPDTYAFDEADRHLSFILEVNYRMTIGGYCWADQATWVTGTETATIQYRVSFYQPPAADPDDPNAFEPEVIAEKDAVNKRYGSFQHLVIFRDPETGLLDARSMLNRWNPKRTEPAVFYFQEGFPPRFKPMFEEIKADTNRIFEEAGANLRVDFREWNDGGVERQPGDIRYSFVMWHQDIDTTRGLLGYGPSTVHPITGEKLGASLNLYNIGLDYYRFMIQDFLESNGAVATEEGTPWEERDCTAGETVAPAGDDTRLRDGLFTEMRRTLDIDEPEEGEPTTDLFLPDPVREKQAFLDDYLRIMPEIRYVNPGWNPYMWRQTGHEFFANYAEQLAIEREHNEAMNDILHNDNPFGDVQLNTRAGIEAQNAFAAKMRMWRKNGQKLQEAEDYLQGRANVYVFNELDAVKAASSGARRCTDDGKWESNHDYTERIIESVVFHVAIHELGHNLSLRHNFYGSIDANHMR